MRPYLALLLVTVALAAPGLPAPLVWDDLHLIRAYSPDELAGAWIGSWDPDGMETPGLRPLTTWFNHERYLLFGELLIAHRLLLLGLFTGYAALLGALARALLGQPPWVGALAGLLAFANVANVPNHLWVADGVHLAAAVPMAGSLLLSARWLRGGAAWLPGASMGLAAVALLTRPEANALFPLLALVALAIGSLRRALGFGAAAAMLLAGYWLWQLAVVPTLEPLRVYPLELAWALWHSAFGIGSFGWLAAPFAVGLMLAVAFARERRTAAFWLVAMLLAALPALPGTRSNLLLLPIGFLSLAVASLIASAPRAAGVAAVLLLVVPSAIASWRLQTEHRHENLEWVCADLDLVSAPGVPPERRAALVDRLTRLGVRTHADVSALAAAAPLGLAGPGIPFRPTAHLLVDRAGSVTPCGDSLRAP